jgi:spore coat polysaccharide biosynthesis predicted glycosyltransferase SpsG
MKVFIITEGGKDIGFGHITRCLSLYQAFEEKGIKPKFIINGDNNIKCLLNGANYQLLNWIEKPDKVFELIKDSDIAIIDSYLVDISVYNTLSDLVKLPVYIDDNKRLDYPSFKEGYKSGQEINEREVEYFA